MTHHPDTFIPIFQEILDRSQKEEDIYHHTINGHDFVIYPGVFSPKYFGSTQFLIDNLDVPKDCTALEIGCGSGVVAVLIAMKGAASVIATDINKIAVENTQANAKLHHMEKKVIAKQGSVFEPVKGKRFDRIFWNYPFQYTAKTRYTILEKSIFDPKYKFFELFLRQLDRHLTAKGEAFVTFSTATGHLDYVQNYADRHNVKLEMVEEKIQERKGIPMKLQILKCTPRIRKH